MANKVTPLIYANTFGDWITVTNQLVAEANSIGFEDYEKSSGNY
jgi:hypothetical protein